MFRSTRQPHVNLKMVCTGRFFVGNDIYRSERDETAGCSFAYVSTFAELWRIYDLRHYAWRPYWILGGGKGDMDTKPF